MKTKKVKVNFEEQETTVEIMADQIKAIADGIKFLRSSKLNDRALLMLIHGACKSPTKYGVKPTTAQIKSVIEGIENLSKAYLK